jgi:hypothetical protein
MCLLWMLQKLKGQNQAIVDDYEQRIAEAEAEVRAQTHRAQKLEEELFRAGEAHAEEVLH